MTTNSLRDGIVLWDMQEQECQQSVCQHSDVVQNGQAGWLMPILQWKMVKFIRWSALAIALLPEVANIKSEFQLKIVDLTSSTTFITHLLVARATAVQTKCEANFPRNSPSLMIIIDFLCIFYNQMISC